MEIKTSKIKEVTSVSDPWGQFKIMYHKLIMENGDKLDIGKTVKQEVGAELNYYFTGDVGQNEYTKAKTPSKNEMENGGQGYNPQNGKSAGKMDEKTQISIIRQVCIKASCQYHTGRSTSGQDVIDDAKLFEAYITGKQSEVPF